MFSNPPGLLERIALHQTRLHTPGLGLDGKGVALGAKGVVLFPSIDRLVAFLAVYTRERSLEALLPSLNVSIVRSKLGTREVVLEFAAESSDRMDVIADTARLAGGFTFTGTSRHFVQYRDAAAPFGYDATQMLATEAALAVYHDRFSQAYDVERVIELRALVLRLVPRAEPSARLLPGARFVVAEQGLGPALVHYLARSSVEGDVCVAEWPPGSAFDDSPVRRWVLSLPETPVRMRPLLESTPGITSFLPVAPGVAVEAGYRHPLALRACPVFDPEGLVFLRGEGSDPWTLAKRPPMGALSAFTHVELRSTSVEAIATGLVDPEPIRVPLRVEQSSKGLTRVVAAWIAPAELSWLRRIVYALPRSTLARATVARTSLGAFVRSDTGIEAIPLGTFFTEVHPRIFVPAGHEVTPDVAPEVLAKTLSATSTSVLFLRPNARPVALEEGAFVPLEAALLEAPPLDTATADEISQALDEPLLELQTTSIGLLPVRGVDSPPKH
jgi:hypothetical protein